MTGLASADFSCRTEWTDGGTAVLAVSGDLDMLNADEVSHVLDLLGERGLKRGLVVDLTACSFIDSVGLSVLIAAQGRSTSPLAVVVTNRALRRVFSVTGLAGVFELHETRGQAIDSLRRTTTE